MVDFSDERKAMAIADELEANVVSMRAVQLYQAPINGAFDRKHLQMIHGALFQDFPRFWLENEQGLAVLPDLAPQYLDFQAGAFRDEVDVWDAWKKGREYPSLKNAELTSFYSRMDGAALNRLDVVLSECDPQALSKLSHDAFAEKLSSIYAELDYVHPFSEGNSRALREFTRELAHESGYELNWKVFNAPKGREELYAARDLALASRAKEDYHDPEMVRAINKTYSELSHKGFVSMSELMQSKIGLLQPLPAQELEQAREIELSNNKNFDMGM